MLKIKLITFTFLLFINTQINNVFAGQTPTILETWLPAEDISANNITEQIGGWLITTMIKYLAVIAVISLMLSWIMYLLSSWEEEKVKKAKNWIIWSLAWVLLSISAIWIIELINNLQINN